MVNQLDNEKCDYDNVLEQLRSIYGSKVVPVQYPLETGPNFHELIDVLLMKKYSWGPEGGAPTIEEIPDSEREKALEMHKALVEAAAENDETLMEKFFESESLTEDEMREGIRKGLAARGMFPVFCVCAGKDMGVRRLMEFLGNVVPFVSDMPVVHNTRGVPVPPDANGPTSLYFFKTAVEPHIGGVQYFKVMSGKVHEGDDLTNADRGSKERMAQLFVCAGANRIPVQELVAGDIGCTVKLKDVKTGNTLNGKDCENRFNFIKYPNAKYSRAIKPVNEADVEKMMVILNRMREEDPTWEVEQSKELKQTIVHGQGEFHLRTLKWRLENNEKLQIKFEEQWSSLKRYANDLGIRIIGDIPIYVALTARTAGRIRNCSSLMRITCRWQWPDARRTVSRPRDSFGGTPFMIGSTTRDTGYRWWMDRMTYCFIFTTWCGWIISVDLMNIMPFPMGIRLRNTDTGNRGRESGYLRQCRNGLAVRTCLLLQRIWDSLPLLSLSWSVTPVFLA
mgnify:CR=1 FL=1